MAGPKRLSARIKTVKSNDFQSSDPGFVLSTFKLRGKDFKGSPKGYIAIDPMGNAIYMGFDRNDDGLIDAAKESFARFMPQINPFEAQVSPIVNFATKFSQPKAKGKIVFKPKEIGDEIFFESFLDKEKFTAPAKMANGEALSSPFTYDDLIGALSGDAYF